MIGAASRSRLVAREAPGAGPARRRHRSAGAPHARHRRRACTHRRLAHARALSHPDSAADGREPHHHGRGRRDADAGGPAARIGDGGPGAQFAARWLRIAGHVRDPGLRSPRGTLPPAGEHRAGETCHRRRRRLARAAPHRADRRPVRRTPGCSKRQRGSGGRAQRRTETGHNSLRRFRRF